MENRLLSIDRLLHVKNQALVVPQTSVLAVNVRREDLEMIRKRKGISVKCFEKKINLSKSRYYRWLNNQIDLPFELLLGIKKVLNLSDQELMNCVVCSTEEQLQTLVIAIADSFDSTSVARNRLQALQIQLEKYRAASAEDQVYQLILAYLDIATATSATSAMSLLTLENYFLSTDYLTMFDILLYLATLYMKQQYHTKTALEKESRLLEKSILRKLTQEQLQEWQPVVVGCAIDLALYYFQQGQVADATRLIDELAALLFSQELLTNYTRELLLILLSIFQKSESAEVITDRLETKIASASWCLPTSELLFLNRLVTQVGVLT